MNKIKTTKKQMAGNFRILGAGYCSMQYLLWYDDPVAYSAGRNGWACDYYDINGVVISTGYAPLSSKNVQCNYAMIELYEARACAIVNDRALSYDQRRDRVQSLLKQFTDQIKDDATKEKETTT